MVAEDGSDEDCTLFPLVAVEDANGNHQRFVYHPLTGLPQYIIDGNGRVFSLNFGNVADEQSPKMRLLSVSLLEGLPSFGETVRVGNPLVRYEYNGSGDLIRVIGRDGNVKRSFGYKNNLMVSHTDAAGLVSEYEYDHYTPTGKVIRNWTSLGEEWRFTYHEGYTEVTDVLGRLIHTLARENDKVQETVYQYDLDGNRTATVLPDGRQINYLYYGSGHLHQISLDDEVISDIERDQLHREIYRTQGKLASRYELDPLGRLKRQIAALNELTQTETAKNAVTSVYAVKRSYGYDRTGNLTHSTDQRTGTTHFEYDKLGRITKAGNELFAFDPAHNILSDHNSPTVPDNRLKTYNGSSYYYDHFGNLIHRKLADGEVQNYFYDLHDQLVKAEIFKKDGTKETWAYTYDALCRRIGKGRLNS